MLKSRLHKIAWGLRTVGLPHTLAGLLRMSILVARRPELGVVRLRSGGTIAFSYPGQLVPALVLFGDVIDPELFFVRKVLGPGSMVFDIGAAIGQFTIVATQVPQTFVHAYEPSSANVGSLRRNIEINGVNERVQVHQAAISTTEGSATFRTTPNSYLSGIITTDVSGETEIVPTHTLPNELARLGIDHVNVVKINVAGFENMVLKGSLPLFEAGRIDVLIVLIGSRVLPMLTTIAGLGYRFFFFDPFHQVLHEINQIDEASLGSPPTPARHVLAIREQFLQSELLTGIPRTTT